MSFFNLCKRDTWFLVVSCLIFPLSLKVSLFFITCFLTFRVIFFDFKKVRIKQQRVSKLLEFALGIAIAITMYEFYWESLANFYPVSYYDYLAIFITFFVARLYPLSSAEIQRFGIALALSPIAVFMAHYSSLDFSLRNDWGFNNPNWLGLYCAICLPLIFTQLIESLQGKLFIKTIPKNQRFAVAIFLSIAWLFSYFMLLTSGSRSSLYTSILVMVLIIGIQLIIFKRSLSTTNLLLFQNYKLLGSLITWLILITLISKFILAKFTFVERFIELNNSTNLYRVKIYQCYFDLAQAKLWWGWGSNQSAILCEAKLKAGFGGVNHAHNFVLQLFADQGLIITLLFLFSLIYLIIIPSIREIANCTSAVGSTIYLGINLSSLSIVIISLFQSGLYHYPLFPLWLGLFWGLQDRSNN